VTGEGRKAVRDRRAAAGRPTPRVRRAVCAAVRTIANRLDASPPAAAGEPGSRGGGMKLG
jgi:hypothetical protein